MGLAVEGASSDACMFEAERTLATEVVRRALLDAEAYYVSPLERAEARLFCIAQSGDWAAARRLWCDLAGVDDELLRSAMTERLGW